MRFVVCLLPLLVGQAQGQANDEGATFVGLVDFRHGPEPPVVTNVGINDDIEEDGHNSGGAADGSKGTHYGDPAEGCMKDEVRVH